jgi:mannosyltransferase
MMRLFVAAIWRQIRRYALSPKTTALLVLAAITLVGAVLRFTAIESESLWVDEIYSLRQAIKSVPAIIDNAPSDVHPPVFYILLHLWTLLFGITPSALRSLSAVLGVCAIPALYALGARLRSRRVGLYAAFFLAFSHFHIHYSQEARSYTYVVLVVILGMHTFTRLLHEYDNRRTRASEQSSWNSWLSLRLSWSNNLWFVLAMLLVLYSHFFALFVVVAQNVFVGSLLFWRRDVFLKVYKRWLGLQVVLLMLFLPWLNILFAQIRQVRTFGFWITRPTPFVLPETLIEFCGSLAAACVLLPLCALAWVKVRRFSAESPVPLLIRASNPAQLVMLGLWFLLPILIPYAQSRLSPTPIFYVKYTIPALPALLLLAALGLDAVPVHLKRWRVAVAGVVLLVCGIAWRDNRNDWNVLEKERWRETAAFADHAASKNDVVFVYPWYCRHNIAYYAERKDLVFQALPTEHLVVKPLTVQRFLAPLAAGRDHVWLVVSHSDRRVQLIFKELEREFTCNQDTIFPSRYRKYMVRDTFPDNTEGIFLMKTYWSKDIRVMRFERR